MRYLAICLISLSFSSTCLAQFLNPQFSHVDVSSRLLYLEFGGNGRHYSLNFDQLIAQGEYLGATSRIGISAFPVGEGVIDFHIPVTISGLIGVDQLYFELGAGVTVQGDTKVLERGAEIMPTGIAGIRYHPAEKGGIFLKAAYTPFLVDQVLAHYGGFGIGIGLK